MKRSDEKSAGTPLQEINNSSPPHPTEPTCRNTSRTTGDKRIDMLHVCKGVAKYRLKELYKYDEPIYLAPVGGRWRSKEEVELRFFVRGTT